VFWLEILLHACTDENKTHASLNREIGIKGDEPTEKIMEFIRTILNKGGTVFTSRTDYIDFTDFNLESQFGLSYSAYTDLQGNYTENIDAMNWLPITVSCTLPLATG